MGACVGSGEPRRNRPWVKTHGYDHQSLRDASHCRVATTHVSRGF